MKYLNWGWLSFGALALFAAQFLGFGKTNFALHVVNCEIQRCGTFSPLVAGFGMIGIVLFVFNVIGGSPNWRVLGASVLFLVYGIDYFGILCPQRLPDCYGFSGWMNF